MHSKENPYRRGMTIGEAFGEPRSIEDHLALPPAPDWYAEPQRKVQLRPGVGPAFLLGFAVGTTLVVGGGLVIAGLLTLIW